jgi:hypothetical protein
MNDDKYGRPAPRATKLNQLDGRQLLPSDRQYPLGTKLALMEILRLKAMARARRRPMNGIMGDLINEAYSKDPVSTD